MPIYACVSGKSEAGEDKTFIPVEIGEMEAYYESKGLPITATTLDLVMVAASPRRQSTGRRRRTTPSSRGLSDNQ